ncbi:MAG: hypothetical protein KatS3mg111_1705 [Pirellulaceae bacterium]|nr:MAG: hypothetical protein KatS3mg111_1705 [Pirellulaceae bacterium]
MGWDYQSLRDASFQRSANWNALFDPSTGQIDESFTVSGDDEVHLTGYQYHPTNGAPWQKTPLEEALEELFPLDYLDTTGDPPSSTDPSSSDQSGDSSDGGDLDGYAGDYQGDVFGEEEGGSSGGVYYNRLLWLGAIDFIFKQLAKQIRLGWLLGQSPTGARRSGLHSRNR